MSDDVYTQVNIEFPEGFGWAAAQPRLRGFFEEQGIDAFGASAVLGIENLYDVLHDEVDCFSGPDDSDSGADFIYFALWSSHRIDGLYGVAVDLTKALQADVSFSIKEEWKYEDVGIEEMTWKNGVRVAWVDHGVHNTLDHEGNVIPIDLEGIVQIANAPSGLPSWVIRDTIRQLLFRLGEDISGIKGD